MKTLRNSVFGIHLCPLTAAFCLLSSALCPPAHAQGTAFTYQGKLEDGGSPADGAYDLTFTLFGGSSDVSAIAGPVTNSPTLVTGGLFTVTLDFGTAFDGNPRWLEIGVRTNGSGAFTILGPRHQITAAPYAIQSANASSAVNVSGPVSAAQLTGAISSNNIGAGSITTVMLAAGAVGSNQLAAGAVTTGALADSAVTATKVATVSNWFALTIANPTPAVSDYFGLSVVAMGSDRLLVGAPLDDAGATDAGAAYLFDTKGALLTTFAKPTPGVSDYFGASTAAVGTDRVLIGASLDDTGAPNAGAAYLFSTNSTLITTFTNPFPHANDFFGISVAAMGSDRVLIGAHAVETTVLDAGVAYLFNTNGTLLATFVNYPYVADRHFGRSVAAVGTDRVLIGAFDEYPIGSPHDGAAYLFDTNGSLITTFTNPTPSGSDNFGLSVAAVGADRVLIGVSWDNTGAPDAGAAYLFSTNGTLLTTFTNPTPVADGNFGRSTTAVGSDRVLIASATGVSLFSTNGALITTVTNDNFGYSGFGYSVAAVGSDQILIGAYVGASGFGAAYLFSLENYTPGLVPERVNIGSITTANLKDGSVTLAKLDPTIGLWTRAGDDVYRPIGRVGIGTTAPTAPLEVAGEAKATFMTFGSATGPKLWLFGSAWGFGIQNNVLYSRIAAGGGYAWFAGGVHNDETFNAGGGIRLMTLTGSGLTVNTSFVSSSDRNLKENFASVQPREMLEKVVALPLSSWNYKTDTATRHVGPMAQDFYAAFNIGPDDKHITTVDADGVALAAIQGLNQKVEDRGQRAEVRSQRAEVKIQKLESENAELKRELGDLKQLVNSLAGKLNGGAK